MGRWVFWFIVFLLVGGILLHLGITIPFVTSWLGHLPGDFVIQKKQTTFYLPITSSALVSLAFSLLIWLFSKKEK